MQKQISKSPKEVKKKPNNMGGGHKSKVETGVFQTTNRNKKNNQSYIR